MLTNAPFLVILQIQSQEHALRSAMLMRDILDTQPIEDVGLLVLQDMEIPLLLNVLVFALKVQFRCMEIT